MSLPHIPTDRDDVEIFDMPVLSPRRLRQIHCQFRLNALVGAIAREASLHTIRFYDYRGLRIIYINDAFELFDSIHPAITQTTVAAMGLTPVNMIGDGAIFVESFATFKKFLDNIINDFVVDADRAARPNHDTFSIITNSQRKMLMLLIHVLALRCELLNRLPLDDGTGDTFMYDVNDNH